MSILKSGNPNVGEDTTGLDIKHSYITKSTSLARHIRPPEKDTSLTFYI